jgi:hypothetical protein
MTGTNQIWEYRVETLNPKISPQIGTCTHEYRATVRDESGFYIKLSTNKEGEKYSLNTDAGQAGIDFLKANPGNFSTIDTERIIYDFVAGRREVQSPLSDELAAMITAAMITYS